MEKAKEIFNLLNKKIQKKIIEFENSKFFDRARYFLNNFWPVLFFIFFLILLMGIKMRYNGYFHTDKITKIIPKSTYAGNAVIINKRFFLTTYDVANNVCKSGNRGEKAILFLITNDGNYHKAIIARQDKDANLAILTLENNDMKNSINNYVVFPKTQETLEEKSVYISKTKNSYRTDFYEKNKIIGASEIGYLVKKNNLRSNRGESVLNGNLEFVGITTGNTKQSKYKFFLNNVNMINQTTIESFLRKNRIYYHKNLNDVELARVSNYLKYINVKVVCVLVQERIPMINIRRR